MITVEISGPAGAGKALLAEDIRAAVEARGGRCKVLNRRDRFTKAAIGIEASGLGHYDVLVLVGEPEGEDPCGK